MTSRCWLASWRRCSDSTAERVGLGAATVGDDPQPVRVASPILGLLVKLVGPQPECRHADEAPQEH